MPKNLIGKRLRLARLMKDPVITQKDLLARLQIQGLYIPDNSISKIEAGTRPVTDIELVAIADALNVTINWLVGENENDIWKQK